MSDSEPQVPVPAAIGDPTGPSGVASTTAAWRKIRSGAGWLFAIAGLSALNTVAVFAGLGFRMLVGLGGTLVTVYLLSGSPLGMAVAGVVTAVGAGGFAVLAVFARKGSRVAYLIAIAIYGLDAILLLWLRDWTGAGFHVFALFWIYQGFAAARGKPAMAPIDEVVLIPTTNPASPKASAVIGYILLALAGASAVGLAVVSFDLFRMSSGDPEGMGMLQTTILLGVGMIAVFAYMGFRFLHDAKKRATANAKAA